MPVGIHSLDNENSPCRKLLPKILSSNIVATKTFNMFGSVTLEVAIGLMFVFILVSILCSAIREGIEAKLKTRAAYLERGIRELLQDKEAKGIARAFYEHPLIFSLFSKQYVPGKDSETPAILANGRNLPSYIPAKNFALALMDIAVRGPETDAVSSDPESPAISIESLRLNILNVRSPFVQRALLTAIDAAQGDINRAQKNIENWFDSAMDRVSGWYKRSTFWILFWIGLIVAVGLNINTISIADYLYRNDIARAALVAQAEAAAKDSTFLQRGLDVRQDIEKLGLPIGWSHGWGAIRHGDEAGSGGIWNNFGAQILGWLLTALAVTMGAPFWFDLLNKAMVIRSTVKPHEKSPEEASEDRQLPKKETVPDTDDTVIAPRQTRSFSSPVSLAATLGVSNIRDEDSSIDGCDVEIEEITPDEDLPAAEGGVQ